MDRKKYQLLIYILGAVLIIINIYFLYDKMRGNVHVFESPIAVGTKLEYEWISSNEDILFLYLKPGCAGCMKYADLMNQFANEYKNNLKVIGLCAHKNYEKLINTQVYRFEIWPINFEIHDALHLGYTPQAILVNKKNVTYAFDYDTKIDVQFNVLKKLLRDLYAK